MRKFFDFQSEFSQSGFFDLDKLEISLVALRLDAVQPEMLFASDLLYAADIALETGLTPDYEIAPGHYAYPDHPELGHDYDGGSEGYGENGSGATAVSVPATGNQGIDGVLAGTRWADGAITYSDTDDVSDYQGNHPEPLNNFSQLTAVQLEAFHFGLSTTIHTQSPGAAGFSVSGFTNLDVTYAGPGDGTATLRGANTSDPGTAYAYYPSNGVWGGDSFYGNSGTNAVVGNYHWHTVLHELGHALGLAHGHTGQNYGPMPANLDGLEYSIMTYRTYINGPLTGYSYESFGAPQTFMMYDIAALQVMYGADFTTNSTDTIYTWTPGSGDTVVNGLVAINPGANRIFATIWDGGGTDTYDLSSYTASLQIDLRPGEASLFSTVQQAHLGSGNFARGNIYNALQYQGDTRSLIENVIGGSGDDTITGNDADNVIDGGAGTDYVVYAGNSANYTVTDNGDGSYLISGAEGDDTLINIEFLTFADGDFDPASLAGPLFTEGNDNVDGSAGADMFFALGGNDTVNGLGGDDIIHGDAGNDTIHGNDDNDQLFGEDGIDRLFGDAGNDILNGGAGDDILSGGSGNDRFIGGAGADTHLGSAGVDIMSYSVSTSRVVLNLVTGGTVGDAAGDSYNSIEQVIGTAFNDDITGGSASDVIFGGNGNDRLFGSGGFDRLNGGAGDDLLSGGDDADTFIGGAGADTHLGGGGLDTIDYSGSSSEVGVDLTTSGFLGDALGDTYFGVEIVIGTAFNDSIDGGSASETLIGGDGNDVIFGHGGFDLIDGGAGNDIMHGGVGHDRFLGGAGADQHEGGANIDTVDYRAATSGVELDLDLGGTVGDAAGDSYLGIERILGTDFDDVIIGSFFNDNLHGYAGDDYISGGNGNDVLFGEAGNDAFGYDTAVDGYDTLADFVTGAGSEDVIHILGGDSAFDTFAEVIAVAYESGTSTVFNFGGVMRLRVLNSQISDFHADDFDFSGPPPGNGGGEAQGGQEKAVFDMAEADVSALEFADIMDMDILL